MIKWFWILFELRISKNGFGIWQFIFLKLELYTDCKNIICALKKRVNLLIIRSYNPVEGDLKSGMPAEVDIPAPHMTITFL